jgi:hypothetical protein
MEQDTAVGDGDAAHAHVELPVHRAEGDHGLVQWLATLTRTSEAIIFVPDS